MIGTNGTRKIKNPSADSIVENRLRIIVFVYSITISVIFTTLAHNRYKSPPMPALFHYTLYVFGLLFVLCAGFLFFAKKKITALALIDLQLLLVIFILYPFEEKLRLGLLLYTALLLGNGIFLRYPLNALNVLVILVVSVLLLRPNRFLGIAAFGQWLTDKSFEEYFSFSVFILAFSIVSCALSFLFGKLTKYRSVVNALQQSISKLSKANMDFQNYAVAIREVAKLNERKRISRDIHDSVGHILTNIKALTEVALSLGAQNPSKHQEIFMQMRDQAQEGLYETRRALRELRSVSNSELAGIKSIYRLVKTFQSATNVEINTMFNNVKWTYGNDIDIIIYHVVQEGLTNSFRHGNASIVNIQFWDNQNELIINITDNGKGSVEFSKGIGLLGMEERLQKLGGRVHARNVKNGFALTVWIPLA